MGLNPKPILAPRRLEARILDFQPLRAENFESQPRGCLIFFQLDMGKQQVAELWQREFFIGGRLGGRSAPGPEEDCQYGL